MKINIFCKTIILLGLASIFSCSQDPIFYTISTEPVPIKPRIEGSPTNMVVFERIFGGVKVPIMYVASGSLHWYAKRDRGSGASGWDLAEYNIPQPGGKTIGLAAAKEYLYALCLQGSGVYTVLRRIGPDESNWQNVNIEPGIRYTLIQSIYADPATGRLFAGARNNNDYGILYLHDTSLRLLESDTEMLSGAASRDGVHYLSTRGKGVYRIADAALSADTGPTGTDVIQLGDLENEDKQNRLFIGMSRFENGSIIVVERDGGRFFEVRESGFRQIKYSNGETVATGRYATGALALWQEVTINDDGVPDYDGGRKILAAGIQGGLYTTTTTSSYTHGYVEFDLEFDKDPDGWLVFTSARRDTSPSITVHGNNDRYTATIGKHPINYMYQTPPEIDNNMTFFASTQTAGLWSYKERSGDPQWNAEN